MRNLLALFLFLGFSVETSGQTTFVTGIVTDKNGKAINLARVDVVGKGNSSVTDDEGKFGFTLARTAKGDLVTFRVTKKGFNVYSVQLAVSALPVNIKLTRIGN